MDEYEWVEAKSASPEPVIKGPTMPPPGFFDNVQKETEEDSCNAAWLDKADFDDLLSLKQTKQASAEKEKLAEDAKRLLQSRELNVDIVHGDDGNISEVGQLEERITKRERSPATNDINKANHIAAQLIRAQLAGDKLDKTLSEELRLAQRDSRRPDRRRHQTRKRTCHHPQPSFKQLVGAAKMIENEYTTGTADLLRMCTMPEWSRTPRFVGESGHSKRVRVSEPCRICEGLSGERSDTKVVCSGEQVCLLVDGYCSLVKHQCFVSTKDHVSSSLLASQSEFHDCRRLMKRLVDGFARLGLECVFVEYSKRIGSGHTRLECYPLSADKFSLAPMHFKKAIQDSEGDWTDNKKIIEFEFADMRKKVPSKLPFFAVSFGLERSFAHIIEDQAEYPARFAKEVLAGLFGLERHEWQTNYCVDLEKEVGFLNSLLG